MKGYWVSSRCVQTARIIPVFEGQVKYGVAFNEMQCAMTDQIPRSSYFMDMDRTDGMEVDVRLRDVVNSLV